MKLFTKQLDPPFQKCSWFTSSTHQVQRGFCYIRNLTSSDCWCTSQRMKSENIPMEQSWNIPERSRTFRNRFRTFHNNNNVGFEKLVQSVCLPAPLYGERRRDEPQAKRKSDSCSTPCPARDKMDAFTLICHTTVTVTDLLSTLPLSLALYSFNYLSNRHTQGQSLAPGTCSTHTGSGLWPAGRHVL